jgi:ribosome-binding factor A
MPREFGRNQRVAGLIKKELASLIQKRFSTNEYGMITLSAVNVSPDLSSAKIYITCLAASKSNDEIVASLNKQAGQFRHDLSKSIISRGIPRLCFLFDESVARGQHMTSLIDSLCADTKKQTE